MSASPKADTKATRSVFVRFYFRVYRAMERFSTLVSMGYSGFWLGVLTSEQLHAIGEVRYGGESFYWTDEYNKKGLWGWEKRVVERDFAGHGHLLLAAAGGGREVFALRQLGIQVDGFDADAGLVRFANEFLEREGMTPDIKLAPWDRCPDFDGKYDGVIVGWGGYTHIRGRERRVMFLRELRDRVAVGSPILLSFYTVTVDNRLFRGIPRIGNVLARIFRRDRVEFGDCLIPNYAHFFTEEQIKSELKESGFEMISFEKVEYGHSVGRAV
jgi:hypothetical protein